MKEKIGLTNSQAKKLQDQFGKNSVFSVSKISFIKILLRQFIDPLVLILILAVILSFITHGGIESWVILVVIFINGFIGFYQEYKAEKGIEALQKMVPYKIKVFRDGKFKQIDTEDIVPGDIVEIHEGDKIPADGIIIECNDLKTNESALTGESELLIKTNGDEIFMGTIASYGSALVEIKNIGMQTRFGEIVYLSASTIDELSPLQKEISKIGKYIGIFVIILTIGIFVFGLIKNGEGEGVFVDSLLYAVSIAVAAVPEGLSTTLIVTFTIAANGLAIKNALVKKLSSVGTLGAVNVICTDKTGTLTKNEMTVSTVIDENNQLDKIIKCGVFCNEASIGIKNGKEIVIGDPTEGCLLTFAKKHGITKELLYEKSKLLKILSFDSSRKMMSVVIKEKLITVYSKGAPESILNCCTFIQTKGGKIRKITNKDKEGILNEMRKYQKEAMRMLAFAYKNLDSESNKKGKKIDNFNIENTEKDLIYLGMVGIIDPPREDVFKSIQFAHEAGIKVIMITGDAELTAESIAKKIGLITENKYQIVNGKDLSSMPDWKLTEILLDKKLPIFARINPADKRRIVELIQDEGMNVAVTGDGVNDAPALKKADIGIAMGIGGTDVAKEYADMVLLDDSFSTIITAIKEGRRVYENLRKFIYYIFTTNIAELVLIIGALILGIQNPLTVILILSINLVTDIFPALALGIEKASDDIVEKRPSFYQQGIFKLDLIIQIFYMGIAMGIVSLYLFNTYLDISYSYAISTCFALLACMQIVSSYNAKSRRLSIFSKKLYHNKYLYLSSVLGLITILFIVQTKLGNLIFGTSQLSIGTWGVIGLFSFLIITIEELRKFVVINIASKSKA